MTLLNHSFYARMSPYLDRRVMSIFVLGIAQGLPWVMIGSMLTLWLKEAGLSRTSIGYAALIFGVYAMNFLWSPLIEMVKLPVLNRIGQRQAWVVLCQFGIASLCFTLYSFDPTHNAQAVVLMCLMIATLSATQDIAIDAYRVNSFSADESEKISASAGMITAGWWTGYAGIGAIPLMLSDHGWSWESLYVLLGIITSVLIIITCFLPNPKFLPSKEKDQQMLRLLSSVSAAQTQYKLKIALFLALLLLCITLVILNGFGFKLGLPKDFPLVPVCLISAVICICAITLALAKLPRTEQTIAHNMPSNHFDRAIAWLLTALVEPMRDFFSRNGVKLALSLLAFILLFKLGEAFLGRMSIVFYKEIGFSNTQIATYSKLVTWWLTVFFALVGGLVNAKLGLVKGLFVSGIAMASTNLLFSLIAIVGPVEELYAIAVVLDGFAAAWSTVAFVSLISLLCNHSFSATQYALLASLSNLGRTTLSAASGQVVDWMDGNWAVFFALTTVMVIPGLLILWHLRTFIESLLHSERAEK